MYVFSSCEFEPSAIPETSVDQPSEISPVLEVELTPETDTLVLYESAVVNYKFLTQINDIHWVQFYFDGELIYQREEELSSKLSVDLNINNYSDGLHSVAINVFVSSKTGSVADKVGAEGYLYQLNWPVVIDRNGRRTVRIREISMQEGGALIKWEKYPFASFHHYRLEKIPFVVNIAGQIDFYDQNTTEYFDHDYLEGENVYYRITVNGDGESGIYYQQKLSPLKASVTSDGKYTLTWEPTKNPDRLDYYRLTEGSDKHNERKIYFDEGSSYSFESLPFGTNVQYNIQYMPKISGIVPAMAALDVASMVVARGDSIPVFEVTKKVSGTNQSIYTVGDKIVLFDHQTRQKKDSILFSETLRMYRISPDGKTVFTLAGDVLQVWRTSDFDLLRTATLSEINAKMTGIWEISVSDNLEMLFSMSSGSLLMYDFKNNLVIFNTSETGGFGYLSPDGNNLFVRDSPGNGMRRLRYFTRTGSALTMVYNSGYFYSNMDTPVSFSSREFNQALLRIDDRIEVRDVFTFQLIKTLPVSLGYIYIYDHETNNFIYENPVNMNNNEYLLMNVTTEKLIDTVNLNSSSVVLHRDFLIGRNGRQIQLTSY